MSVAARIALIKNPHLFISSNVVPRDQIVADLGDVGRTSTYVIQGLQNLLDQQVIVELLIARYGHHDDGPHGHFGGFCVDVWPLRVAEDGAWLAAGDLEMRRFLRLAAQLSMIYQIGLAGTSDTAANQEAASYGLYFPDTGGDHIHLGFHDESFGC